MIVAVPEQFWMVFGMKRGAPTMRHASRENAEREAKRLARQMPDEFFVVLEAVSATIKRDCDTFTLRAREEDLIPF